MPVAKVNKITDTGVAYEWATDQSLVSRTDFVRWDGILLVRVFKRDLVAYDLICLTLEFCAGTVVELDEEDPLWSQLLKTCELHLNGFRPTEAWYSSVAFPAFVPNEQIVYERQPPLIS